MRIIEAWLRHIILNTVRQNLLAQTGGWGEGGVLSCTEVPPSTVGMCMYRTIKLIGTGVILEKGSLDSVTLLLYALIYVDSLSHNGLLNLKGFTSTWSWPTQLYSGVCLEGLRNSTKLRGIVSQPIFGSFRLTRGFRFSQQCS